MAVCLPEGAILGADQKQHGLWGREWQQFTKGGSVDEWFGRRTLKSGGLEFKFCSEHLAGVVSR